VRPGSGLTLNPGKGLRRILCEKNRVRWRCHIPTTTSRKPLIFLCTFLPYFFLLHFFHCVHTSLGFVCVVFFNVLCCLDFGVWIIKLIFFHFSLLFPPPFLTLTLFYLFFSLLLLSFEPLFLWTSCLVLPHHLVMPCVASNYYLVPSPRYVDLLPHITPLCRPTTSYHTASFCYLNKRKVNDFIFFLTFNPFICKKNSKLYP